MNYDVLSHTKHSYEKYKNESTGGAEASVYSSWKVRSRLYLALCPVSDTTGHEARLHTYT